MMPKVSIIVPCYKVEKYLDRCITSLVNQTLKDIEIILVDDGSPDNVPAMCDEWALRDNRIKTIHKKNAGLGYARNSGLEIASGEYIAFVDSDDFVHTDMYRRLYEKAITENSDAVYCNCIFFKDENNQIERKDVTVERSFNGRKEVDSFLLDMIGPEPKNPKLVKYMMSVWHAVYKEEIIGANDILFVSEREYVSEDAFFDIDFLHKANSVIYIPDTLYYYCDNDASLSRNYDDIKYDRLKLYLVSLQDKLSSLFKEDDYYNHYLRQMFLHLITALKKSVKQDLSMSIEKILEDEFWMPLLEDYPYMKMTLRNRLFFLCLRHKCLYWVLKYAL